MPNRSTQQRLQLSRAPTHARRDYIVSAENGPSVATLDTWPAWPGGRLALIGPEGCGKTHLALAWADRANAVVFDPANADFEALRGRAILLEDADRRPADMVLFDLINMTDAGASLLVTGRTPPLSWPTNLPDLRSRLNALVVAPLAGPDDLVLAAVLRKFFRQRNIRVADDVLAYLLRRIERSVPAAWDVVSRIDERADAEGREITRPLAREVLEAGDAPLDMFD